MSDKILITKEKKKALEKELHYIKTEIRPDIVKRVQFAKSLGDLSENAEYHLAREEQGKAVTRIEEIEFALKNAEVIKKTASTEAQLMSVIVIQKDGEKEKLEFELVSPTEADMSVGKLSIGSPIGEAVFGKSAGDIATVKTPNGDVVYNVLEVK